MGTDAGGHTAAGGFRVAGGHSAAGGVSVRGGVSVAGGHSAAGAAALDQEAEKPQFSSFQAISPRNGPTFTLSNFEFTATTMGTWTSGTST